MAYGKLQLSCPPADATPQPSTWTYPWVGISHYSAGYVVIVHARLCSLPAGASETPQSSTILIPRSPIVHLTQTCATSNCDDPDRPSISCTPGQTEIKHQTTPDGRFKGAKQKLQTPRLSLPPPTDQPAHTNDTPVLLSLLAVERTPPPICCSTAFGERRPAIPITTHPSPPQPQSRPHSRCPPCRAIATTTFWYARHHPHIHPHPPAAVSPAACLPPEPPLVCHGGRRMAPVHDGAARICHCAGSATSCRVCARSGGRGPWGKGKGIRPGDVMAR